MSKRECKRRLVNERVREVAVRTRVRAPLLEAADAKAVAEGLTRPGMFDRALQLYVG